MKKLSMLVIATLFSTAAYAGDINESPIRGKGAISVVHNEPACTRNCGYTTEQINRSLEWLGRPGHEQIGRSRVLADDGAPAAGVTRNEIAIQFK